MPVVPIHAEVHTILLHIGIPDNIGCPQVAGKVIIFTGAGPSGRFRKIRVNIPEKRGVFRAVI